MTEPREELRESWFGKPVRPSEPPPVVVHERPKTTTFALGAAAGALGGVTAVITAGVVTTRSLQSLLAIAEAIGRAVNASFVAGFAIGALVGALLGGLLALVMRHGASFVGRVLFASASTTALWFCFHVLLIARHRAVLPIVPMIGGACVYAVFVAAVPPSRRIIA